MFYVLGLKAISLCEHRGAWVYAWHFEAGAMTGGGRVNPEVLSKRLIEGSWDIRKHHNLYVKDQEQLEKDFLDWCDRWFLEDPKAPPAGAVIAGEHATGNRDPRRRRPF